MDLNFAKSLSSGLELVRPLEPMPLAGKSAEGAGGFQSVLGGVIAEVKSTRHEAHQQTAAWLNGEQTDIHHVATSIQKAGLTFELALEVRNKMMQAYQEVMRMQI